MVEILLRRAKGIPEEAEHFAELMEMSAPEYFPDLLGRKFKELFRALFLEEENLFSHKHVIFAVYENRIAGMLLGYDWKVKEREEKRTGWLMLKALGFDFLRQLPGFISAASGSGRLEEGDYYISNVAVYPEFRGKGIGKALMLKAEELAGQRGARRVALDVEKDNENAIRIYKKLGYSVVREHSIELGGRRYRFYRMVSTVTPR
jgi:ribosomal protein S18 acetylase RimI-like enzyme